MRNRAATWCACKKDARSIFPVFGHACQPLCFPEHAWEQQGCQSSSFPHPVLQAALQQAEGIEEEGQYVLSTAQISVLEALHCPAAVFELVVRGEHVGIRCPWAGGRLLQARRRSHHQLAFFSTMFGVWEQFVVSACTHACMYRC